MNNQIIKLEGVNRQIEDIIEEMNEIGYGNMTQTQKNAYNQKLNTALTRRNKLERELEVHQLLIGRTKEEIKQQSRSSLKGLIVLIVTMLSYVLLYYIYVTQ